MSAFPPPPDPQALLERAGLRAKKSWGQNFLRDARVLAAIADATGAGPEAPVLELGAGLGALTYHLLCRGGRVFAVERDREVAPLLREALSWAERLEVVEADAAAIDYAAWRERLGAPVRVAGNLPYQIGSRILVSLADAHRHIESAVVMVQREVAERAIAAAGSRKYGLLSVLVGRSLAGSVVRHVAPGAFHPRPKVDSTVLRLVPHGEALDPERDAQLVAAARAAFSARRKTVRNAIAGGLGVAPSEVERALRAAGVDPGARAETLDVSALAAVGAELARQGLLAAG